MARRKSSVRRRARRAYRGSRKLLSSQMVKQAGFTALGGVGSEMAVSLAQRQMPSLTFLASPVGAMAAKGVIGIAGGYLVTRFMGKDAGQAFTIGALSSVATDLANRVFNGGLSGLGMGPYSGNYLMAGENIQTTEEATVYPQLAV